MTIEFFDELKSRHEKIQMPGPGTPTAENTQSPEKIKGRIAACTAMRKSHSPRYGLKPPCLVS
jgi:hypothetical protein